MKMLTEITSDCRAVDRELDRGFGAPGSNLSEQVRWHLEQCERCSMLYEWAFRGIPSAPSSPELYGRIQSAIQGSLERVSPLPPTRVIAFEFGTTFLQLAIPAAAMMGLGGVEKMNVFQLIAITVGLALGVALLALSLAWQVTPGSLQRISMRGAVSILIAGFIVGVVFLFPWHTPEAFLARGWPCLRLGLVMALPAGLLFWLVARRGAPLEMKALGGTLGAISGLLGVSVLQFHCDRQETEHLLFWHGGVLLVSTVAGVLIASAASRVTLGYWRAK
jgi:negative regulator of sigma F NrsF-like protein